jgi:flagellar biosynthesis anti-sigma factor FlgM
MRIDLNHGPQQADNIRSSAQNTAGSTSANHALGEDQAQLSGTHVQVAALAAQASQLPEVREEKVQALRQAVQGGHYQASPEKIAVAMFSHMLTGPAA